MGQSEFEKEQQNVVSAYTERFQQHGDDVRSLNWGSKESQETRFRVLVEAGIKDGMSVLDVGCGLADFYAWSLKQNLKLNYHGLDVTPAMIKASSERFPENEFSVGDISTWKPSVSSQYDFVIASGIFYDRPESGHSYLKNAVEAMFCICKQGLAFNTITSLADQPDANEFLPSPEALTSLAQEQSTQFTIRHDYHPCDATVYLYKSE